MKYLWYCCEIGEISNDFDTIDECIADAEMNYDEIPAEYGIYSYDEEMFPDGDVTIDDCNYECFFGGNE